MRDSLLKYRYILLLTVILIIAGAGRSVAAPMKKLDKPPFSESWFGIYVDKERVGFYRQTISETADGYRMEGDGSVRIKTMGISREETTRANYLVSKSLALRSFDVEQNFNGVLSHVTGRVNDSTLRVKIERNGSATDRQIKIKGDVYPGPALNLYPLMRPIAAGKSYKILTFDPEEIKVKEVNISVLGEEKSPEGQPSLKLRNNIYPFVNNDIWIDAKGNTLYESVREGLVTTKSESSKALAGFVGSVAISRKDLIYDFSLVRAEPAIKDQSKLKGLAVEISGWNDDLPLMKGGGQVIEKPGAGRIIVRTGSAIPALPESAATTPAETAADAYLKPAEKIEADAPEIAAKAKEIAAGKNSPEDVARALTAWTADWLKDTVEDGGGAVASLKSRHGNCQTHARLYTALARAAGIPTRFVSGLVALEGKGFLYHSWAESLLGGRWVAVDPTYNQLPADATHLKFFEGHTQDDIAPIIAIIGRIRINVLEAKYE
jgi:hypothetical protein